MHPFYAAMARLPLNVIQQFRKKKVLLIYTTWMQIILSFNSILQIMHSYLLTRRTLREKYTIFKLERNQYIHRLIHEGPSSCVDNLRMDKISFYKLCYLLESRDYVLKSRHVSVIEKVAIFLYILGHHTKQRGIHAHFQRSKQSISRYFHTVLNGILRLQGDYFEKPNPIQNDSTDKRWKHFKVLIILYVIQYCITYTTMWNVIVYI